LLETCRQIHTEGSQYIAENNVVRLDYCRYTFERYPPALKPDFVRRLQIHFHFRLGISFLDEVDWKYIMRSLVRLREVQIAIVVCGYDLDNRARLNDSKAAFPLSGLLATALMHIPKNVVIMCGPWMDLERVYKNYIECFIDPTILASMAAPFESLRPDSVDATAQHEAAGKETPK
jgi:hypothetical protein